MIDLYKRLGMNLAKHKEGILRERDRLNAEVEELNKRLQIQRIYTDEIEQKRTDSEKKNKELYKLLDVRTMLDYNCLSTVIARTYLLGNVKRGLPKNTNGGPAQAGNKRTHHFKYRNGERAKKSQGTGNSVVHT